MIEPNSGATRVVGPNDLSGNFYVRQGTAKIQFKVYI
jgi:hypothetical protein